MIRLIPIAMLLCWPLAASAQWAAFQVTNTTNIPPTADVVCDIVTGIATGVGSGGAGTCSTPTGTPCNGVQDDANIFASFNNWAVNTWQMAHTGLIQLTVPTNGTCTAATSGTGGKGQNFTVGIKRLQVVGSNTTMSDGGAGSGFAYGPSAIVNDDAHSSFFVTISAGATSITISDLTKCGLFAADDWTLLGGANIINQSGSPPTWQYYEFIQIDTVSSCAGSGLITFKTATRYGYKSTWPIYWVSSTEASHNNGPGQVFALDQRWVANLAYYNLIVDGHGTHTNANGMHVAFYNVSTPSGNTFGPIPSQNMTWTIAGGSFPDVIMEVDKVVENVIITDLTVHVITIQSGNNPQNFTCTRCSVTSAFNGATGNTTFVGGAITSLIVGATSFGANNSFVATNTQITDISLGGANGESDHIQARGIWASGSITIPPSTTVSAAADDGTGKIRMTVASTAGYAVGVGVDGPGGNCSGFMTITNIPAGTTHLDFDASFTGTCSGSIGNFPVALTSPGSYFRLVDGGGGDPVGPIFQIADLAVDGNGSIVVSLNQGGSPYAGGFPVAPGTTWTAVQRPALSWSCVGCTGSIQTVDLSSPSATGLPVGSYVSRTITAANNTTSGATSMLAFGLFTELDVTVNPACSGASLWSFGGAGGGGGGGIFYSTLGSSMQGTWNPTVDASVGSATPRKVFPTTSSGALGTDSLATPGTGAWISTDQQITQYSAVGNCSTASTVVTIITDQGIP